jgi:hypothetical protein
MHRACIDQPLALWRLPSREIRAKARRFAPEKVVLSGPTVYNADDPWAS